MANESLVNRIDKFLSWNFRIRHGYYVCDVPTDDQERALEEAAELLEDIRKESTGEE